MDGLREEQVVGADVTRGSQAEAADEPRTAKRGITNLRTKR